MTTTVCELFGAELWNRAVESYGGAVHVRIKLSDASGRMLLGCYG